MFQRYAIYYAPEPGSPLDQFGRGWFGRDAYGEPMKPFAETASYANYSNWIAAPYRYGFHGTLKAPFRLAPGHSAEDLHSALAELSAETKVIRAPALQLTHLGNFLALCLNGGGPNKDIDALAAACVEHFDPYRAPLTPEEMARRKPETLSMGQRGYLERWGYPYVFDEFRFHLSLTGALDPQQIDQARQVLTGLLADFSQPEFAISSLCLFGDPGNGKPFQLIKRYELAS